MIIVWYLFIVYPYHASANCQLPQEFRGIWIASDLGEVTFQTNTMATEKSVVNFGPRTFTCAMKVGEQYLLTSDVFNFYGSPFQLGLCWEFQKISETQFTYYAAMDVLPNTANARILFRLNPADFNLTSDCQFKSSYDPWHSRVLLKSGVAITSQCPKSIQANFTYTFDSGSGNRCPGNTSLDICSDATAMVFDYSLCSVEQGYSATGSLTCVHQKQYNSQVYLIVFNNDQNTPDEVTRFRFTCYVIQQNTSDPNVIHMTQYPQACLDDVLQTSVQVVSPGAYLQLQISSTGFCGLQEKKDQSLDSVVSAGAIAAIAAVFGTFVMFLSTVSGVKLYKKCKQHSVKPVHSQSVSSLASFDRVQSMFSLDGRISPFSLRPTLSEIAYKRFGSSTEEFDYMNDDTDDLSLCDSIDDDNNSFNDVDLSLNRSNVTEK